MQKFTVEIPESVEKVLNGFDPKLRLRLLQVIKSLKDSPFLKGEIIEKFKGLKNRPYRKRVGNFRIIYLIDGKKVVVLLVVDKKDFEKNLKTLRRRVQIWYSTS